MMRELKSFETNSEVIPVIELVDKDTKIVVYSICSRS